MMAEETVARLAWECIRVVRSWTSSMVSVPRGMPVEDVSRRRVVVRSIQVSSGIWGFLEVG